MEIPPDIPAKDWRNAETHNGKWIVGMTDGQKGGFYVEAGAWDGIIASSSYVLEKHFGWHGLLVEPTPAFLDKLTQNRPKSHCFQALLSDENSSETFLRFPHLHGYSCMERVFEEVKQKVSTAHEEAGKELLVEKYEVEAMTLERALLKCSAPRVIDFVSLDIEGAEYLVLKDFPFEKYHIRYICLEDVGEKLHQLMLDKGFERVTNPFNLDAPRESYYTNKQPFYLTKNIKPEDLAPLKLVEDVHYPYHRFGWRMATQSLRPLFNRKGILFDSFLDRTFSRKDEKNPEKEKLPYQEPWIGIFHNPPHAPDWAPIRYQLHEILALPEFQESLPHCKGLFALSEHLVAYLREKTGKPVSVLYHPTELAVPQFDMEAFLHNPFRKVCQLGFWLRRLNSIYQLPLEKGIYRKILLLPPQDIFATINRIRMEEQKRFDLIFEEKYFDNTFGIRHLSADDYDDLLTKNIAFLDLYDASANNSIIECIARATPILVNRIAPTVEYLGEDYPFYFASLEEAAAKALDFQLVEQTHHYLKNWHVREKLTAQYFIDSFVSSEVYQQFILAPRT